MENQVCKYYKDGKCLNHYNPRGHTFDYIKQHWTEVKRVTCKDGFNHECPNYVQENRANKNELPERV